MKKVLLGLLAVALFATSCKKEKSIEPNVPGGSGSDGGNYQPSSKNSYWKYKVTGSVNYETTNTSTGQARTINGITGIGFNSTSTAQPGTSEGVFAIKDHVYSLVQKGTSPNSGASFDLSFPYLNDTASVGYSWRHNGGQANGLQAIFDCKVIEKGISVTVEGKTYKDVIHTEVELLYNMPGFGEISFMIYDFYVARNVGIVQILSEGDPMWGQGLKTSSSLIEYQIK